MLWRLPRFVLPVWLLAGLLASGCHRASPEERAASPNASPVSERDRERQEAFAAAIDGLHFDAEQGLIEVEPLERNAETAIVHAAAAEGFMRQNRYSEAIARYTLAIRSAPHRADLFEKLGSALLYARRTKLAIMAFRTAVERDPASTSARYNLGYALSMADRRAEAIETLDKLVAMEPGHGKAHERLAVWRFYAGENAQAWTHVHAARAAGHEMPAQFIRLLEARMPEPTAPGPGS